MLPAYEYFQDTQTVTSLCGNIWQPLIVDLQWLPAMATAHGHGPASLQETNMLMSMKTRKKPVETFTIQ